MGKRRRLTSSMGPRGLARRLELLAAQIRMGRRESLSFSITPNKTAVVDGCDGERSYVSDGTETFSLTVTELESAPHYRSRMRRRG